MKTIVRIWALTLLLLAGCRERGETDIHGRPVKPLPVGQVRIAVTEKAWGRIDLRVFLSGNMAGWSHVGICYAADDDPAWGLPDRNDRKDETSIKAGRGAYDFSIRYHGSPKWYTIRAFVRSDDFRLAYGDHIKVYPQEESGTWAVPAAPGYRICEDSTAVTLTSSVSGKVSGLKERGFCLSGPGIRPDKYTPRIKAGDGFCVTVDTLRRGILYAVWAYLEDDFGLRFSDSVHLRIPAPELAPEVRTLEGTTVYVRWVTAGGRVIDAKGSAVEKAGFEWRRSEADFDNDVSGWRGVKPDADGTFSVSSSVSRPGRWYYRAFATTAYGTGFGEVMTVEVPDYTRYLPVVSTDARPVKNTASTVTVSGRVESDGGLKITERGFCHSTFSDPKDYESPVEVSGTTGKMMATIEGVPMDKTYYYRAYAKNAAGTTYGEVRSVYIRSSDYEVVFRDLKATVNSDGSVTFGVRIWDDRGQKFRERGFCWEYASYSAPTISDYKEKTWSSYGSSYEVKVSAYKFGRGREYRVRAYVITDDETVWYSDKYEKVLFTVPEK